MKPSRRERRQMKRLARDVFAAMLSGTEDFKDRINQWQIIHIFVGFLLLVARYALAFVVLFIIGGGVALQQQFLTKSAFTPSFLGWGVVGCVLAGFVLSIVVSVGRRDQWQSEAVRYVDAAKLENISLFPFNRDKRDASKNRSGRMIRAVERQIQVEPRYIHQQAEKLAGEPRAKDRGGQIGLPRTMREAALALGQGTPAVKVEKYFERKRVFDYLGCYFRILDDEINNRKYFLQARGVRNAI